LFLLTANNQQPTTNSQWLSACLKPPGVGLRLEGWWAKRNPARERNPATSVGTSLRVFSPVKENSGFGKNLDTIKG
jgi:hypothetical protein